MADNYSGGPPSLGSIRNGRIFGGTGQTISTSNGIFLGGDPAGVISSSTALATNQTFYDLDVQNFKDDFIVGNNTYVDTWVGGFIALSSEAGIHFKSGTTNTGENFALLGVDFGNNQSHDILVDSNASAEINATGTSFDYAGGDSISSAGSLYLNASSSHFERNAGDKFINCSGSCSVGVANSAMYLKGNAASTDAFGQFAATSRASFVGVDWANFSSTSAISQFFMWNDSSGSLYMLSFRNTLGLALDIVPAYSGSAAPLRFFDSRALIANQVTINQTAIAAPRLASGRDLNTVTQCGLYDVQNAADGPSVFGTGFFHLQVLCTNDTKYQDQVAYDMTGGTNRSFIRHETGGTWSAWVEQLSPDNSGNQGFNGNTILPFTLTGYHGTSGTKVQLSDGTSSKGNEAVANDGTLTNSTAGSAGHATCWTAVGQIGYCSTAVDSTGTCNCH